MGRKKKKPAMIPNDVIIEILSRAPANSLMRFQWACKYLFDLIKDPKFVKLHLLHHSTTPEDDDQFINNDSLLILSKTTPKIIYSMRCRDVFNPSLKKLHFDFYNHVTGIYSDKLLGSCNGLLYFRHSTRSDDSYFLWNPCTREMQEIPEPKVTHEFYNSKFIIHGFGYDHTIQDYKVIRVVYYSPLAAIRFSYDSYGSRETCVYTLGSNTWSTKYEGIHSVTDYKDIVLSKNVDRSLALFFNGVLHWIMKSAKLVKIMYFDIGEDEHGQIQLADDIATDRQSGGTPPWTFDVDLCVLRGCLCISLFRGYDMSAFGFECMDVWMLKDYCVKDCWTKVFTINMNLLLNDIFHWSTLDLYDLKLLKYNKDGELLAVFNGKYYIVMQPAKKDLVRYVNKVEDDDKFENLFVGGTYTGTLVSLNSDMFMNVGGSRTTRLYREIEEKEDL